MDPAIGPGDIRPRHLEQPPGERYREVEPPIRERPDMWRAVLLGALVGIGVAVVAGLMRSILDVTLGLVVVAGAGGWAVGLAIRLGAWRGMAHQPSAAPGLAGVILGAVTWLAALVAAWVVAMAILPGSARSVPERLLATPFLEWLAPQAGLADLLCVLLASLLGWAGARSRSVPRPSR